MGLKFTAAIDGVRELQQSLKLMNETTRVRVRAAIQETTEAVAARSRANVPVSGPDSRKAKGRPGPGELRDTIRTSYSLGGMAGFVNAGYGKLPRRSKATKPPKIGPVRLATFQRQQKRAALKALREIGVYAMVIEYGSPGRGMPAAHYMTRAKEAEAQAHISRIQRALAGAAQASRLAA